ncbi:methyltransferase domain-containing protein [Mycena belliarum]|uniref:Methyltransferase domain-containing protein n=1 Tax=Mycena belliarum TaxID=1033014 RepID=A0AAD6TW07_9AGAR|nr:methyltransferase domain-containing protein [Mycena belliae]
MSLLTHYRLRYAVGAVVLFIWALYAYSSAYMRPRPPSHRLCGTHLRDALRESEAEYQDTVRQRKAMIRKYGPSPAEVESFPTHGEFYTLWDFFPPAYQCPHRVQRIGQLGDGGKYLCGLALVAAQPACVVYSFGINSDSSFEADLLQRAPRCEVFGYDFSVRSFGPEITAHRALARRAHFFPYALGAHDAHAPADAPPTYTLRSLMRANGHVFVDILKIDIEGSEFAALEAFLDSFSPSHALGGGGVLPFGQLQLEIHATGETEYKRFPRFLEWWEKLENMGLRPFFSEANLVYVNLVRGVMPDLIEYSFINTRGGHALLVDPPDERKDDEHTQAHRNAHAHDHQD